MSSGVGRFELPTIELKAKRSTTELNTLHSFGFPLVSVFFLLLLIYLFFAFDLLLEIKSKLVLLSLGTKTDLRRRKKYIKANQKKPERNLKTKKTSGSI